MVLEPLLTNRIESMRKHTQQMKWWSTLTGRAYVTYILVTNK